MLTTADLCDLLGVTRQRVSQLARDRGVRPVRRGAGGQTSLWRHGDLERLRPMPTGRPRPPRP